jgi:hypothetical protein
MASVGTLPGLVLGLHEDRRRPQRFRATLRNQRDIAQRRRIRNTAANPRRPVGQHEHSMRGSHTNHRAEEAHEERGRYCKKFCSCMWLSVLIEGGPGEFFLLSKSGTGMSAGANARIQGRRTSAERQRRGALADGLTRRQCCAGVNLAVARVHGQTTARQGGVERLRAAERRGYASTSARAATRPVGRGVRWSGRAEGGDVARA